MKRTIKTMVFLFLLNPFFLMAQDYSQELPGGKELTVKIENVLADLTIRGSNSNVLSISATGLEPPPEKAEGLRALKRTGIDNTGLALNITEYEDMIILSGGSGDQDLSYSIQLPARVNLVIISSMFMVENQLSIAGMSGEIEIQRVFGDVKLSGITGPVVARVDNGEFSIAFTELNQASPMSLMSSQGDIDITLPGNSKATFNLMARNGEIYTDLDLVKIIEEPKEKTKSDLRIYSPSEDQFVTVPAERSRSTGTYRGEAREFFDELMIRNLRSGDLLSTTSLGYTGPYDFKGTLNEGGVEISIRSYNGNLYLRKSK